MPIDREEDWSVAEDGKVEGAVGVLPNVVTADHEVLAEALLKARMKFIAVSRCDYVRSSLAADDLRYNRIRATPDWTKRGFY